MMGVRNSSHTGGTRISGPVSGPVLMAMQGPYPLTINKMAARIFNNTTPSPNPTPHYNHNPNPKPQPYLPLTITLIQTPPPNPNPATSTPILTRALTQNLTLITPVAMQGPWDAKTDALIMPVGLDPARPRSWLVPAGDGNALHFHVAGAAGYSMKPYFEVQEAGELFSKYPCFG